MRPARRQLRARALGELLPPLPGYVTEAECADNVAEAVERAKAGTRGQMVRDTLITATVSAVAGVVVAWGLGKVLK